jgi:hypothetical protein
MIFTAYNVSLYLTERKQTHAHTPLNSPYLQPKHDYT